MTRKASLIIALLLALMLATSALSAQTAQQSDLGRQRPTSLDALNSVSPSQVSCPFMFR